MQYHPYLNHHPHKSSIVPHRVYDADSLSHSILAEIPSTRVLDKIFLLSLSEARRTFEVNGDETKHYRFDIQTVYLQEPVKLRLELTYSYQTVPTTEKDPRPYQKEVLENNLIQFRNKIEFLLSIPLNDLALYVNDTDGTEKLVAWRYQIPEPPETKDQAHSKHLQKQILSRYKYKFNFTGSSLNMSWMSSTWSSPFKKI